MATARESAEQMRKKRKEEGKSSASAREVAETIKRYNSLSTDNVDQKYIDSFVSDYNAFINTAEEEYKGVGWANASSAFDSRSNAWNELSTRADTISAWLYKNRNNGDYDGLTKTLNDIRSGGSSVVDAFKSSRDYYSQWRTEEDYRQTADALDAEDFEEFSQKGLETGRDKDFVHVGFDKDNGGLVLFSNVYNNDLVVYRDQIKEHGWIKSGDERVQVSRDARYARHMSDEEFQAYTYYYGKYGEKKANEYLDSLEEIINNREAGVIYNNVGDNKALQLLMGAAAGIDQFASGVKNLFTEDDYYAPSSTQIAGSQIREDLSGGWQVAYDLVNTTANMLPSILVGSFTGGLGGAATLGASAMGNAYADMINLGYSKGQASFYGVLVGASETGLQYLLGGIGGLGGKLTGKSIGAVVSKIDNALARAAIKLGGNMASEGLEEMAQSVLEPWFKSLATGTDFEAPDIDEVLYSGLLGALSAAFLEGAVGGTVGAYKTYQSGKDIKSADATEKLTALGKTFAADTVAYKLAGKVNKDTGAYTIGRLLNEVGATLTEQNMTDIENALVEKGMTLKDAKVHSKWINKAVNGAKFTNRQVNILNSNDIVADVVTDVLITQNTTVNQRKMGYAEILELANDVSGAKVSTAPETVPNAAETATVSAQGAKAAQEVTAPSEAQTANSGKFSVSTDGKTTLVLTGEEVSVEEVASVENGEVFVKLNNGETVNAKEVNFSTEDEALIYEAVADMNAATANSMIKGYDPSEGVSANDYTLGFKEAYKYGSYGFPVSEMSRDGFSAKLTEAQKHRAYSLGSIDGKAAVAAAQKAKAVATDSANTDKSEKKEGKVYFDKGTAALSLNSRQKTSVKALETIAKAIGVDFHVFESAKGERGNRLGANGWYDPKDNSIHIDLFAGASGEGTMLFTAAHELTHFIREWSPAKFKVFADFLLEQYGAKGISVDELVHRQIAKAKKNGRTISYDTAYEEVIADSCEAMLTDSNAIEKIAQLKAKDATLWEKIKSFITELVAKIKKAYANLNPDSVEANHVRKMVDAAERLQELWTDALLDAGETYSVTNDMVQVDADSQSVAPVFSERTWTESAYVQAREDTAKKISKELGVSINTAYKYIDDINSVASLIADDRVRLDYEPNLDSTATVIKPNSDYKWSVDMSTLCAKRLLFTGTFDAIQRAMPNTAFDSDDIVRIRSMMEERGYEVACGICYVESTRREIGTITADFIERYKLAQKTGKPITRVNSEGKVVELRKTKDQMQTTADSSSAQFYADKSYTPTLAELNTTDIDLVKRDHPLVYEAYLNYMNARGQAKPKLLETRAEYKGEILKHFKYKSAVTSRNNAGGLRLQSFSDFEVPHLIDMMQITMDMARVGLKAQAYTKVPNFAEAFGNTGIKINLSLIAKGAGLDSKGNLIFDDKEGIDHSEAFRLRDEFSKNVGTILVGKNDQHIIAAMADPRIDYIIPFHKSSWKESLYDALGLTGYDDYTDFQNEKPIDKSRTIKNFDPSEYWDFSKTGDENAQIYLEKCREDGRIPKFPQFQSYEGYWKLLIDFKMYDNDGVGAPQEVVQPIFDNAANEKILSEYKGGHRAFPVAKDVVKDFVKEKQQGVKFSVREVEEISNADYRAMFDHFGTTKNYDVAGYMLQNGVMLDFSGKHWGDDYSTSRQVDHRDIQETLDRGNNGINGMIDMIGNGNIRLMPEIGGINLAVKPNDTQMSQLRGYINHFRGEVVVDIDEVGGDTIHSFSYNRGTSSSKILSDIKAYFDEGVVPERKPKEETDIRQFLFSDRVTDKETLDFLENQDHVTVYRAMQVIDGKLYPPMNAYTKDANGKKVLMPHSEIGAWEQSVERPDLIDPKTGKFKLDKGKVDGGKKGTPIPAAYNPYIHTSLSMLNDQFTSAYTRSNLVVVKGLVPKSELTSGYRAQYAKDSVGETAWHSGVVSTQLPESRRVILSRWFKPVEIMSDDAVAQGIKDMLGDTGVVIPYNVVSPKLRRSLEKLGVPIGEGAGLANLPAKDSVKYSDRDYSYESLVSKPDMKLTIVGGNVPSNRADVVATAKKNAAKVGKYNPKDGSVSVRVNDTGDDVVISTGGLRHSLDRRFDVNAPVTVKAGEILQNSIKINEMTPENTNAESSYVLIGAARNEKGKLYIVRSVVNRFKSELVSMDVLYAINAKTEPNLSIKKGNQAGGYPQGSLSNDSFLTDSAVSIAQLLEFVNRYFPDILPESVLRHFGHDARPEGKLGENVLYSDRDSYAPTFYSHMGKVVDDIKIQKMGAGGVVSYLKGKGVKNEEIKWSGIEAFLEGKKSVTKEELQEFVAGSRLQIVEQISDTPKADIRELENDSDYAYARYDEDGNIIDKYYYDHSGELVSDITGEEYLDVETIKESITDDHTRWHQYKLDGGSNYREMVFQMPNSSYSNQAMQTHWGEEAEGIIAHARVQDFDTAKGKMLFVEEIQSDWHNEGANKGYAESTDEARREELSAKVDEAFYRLEDYSTEVTGLAGEWETIEKTEKGAKLLREYREAQATYFKALDADLKKIPDAPFRTTYHEYVMKRLIRMAAEEGYDIIGWTPSEIQSKRWSSEFAEAYRIEYDQEIPKFLKKYGKKWGAEVGETSLQDAGGTEFVTDTGKTASTYVGAKMLLIDEANESGLLSYVVNPWEVTAKGSDVVTLFDQFGVELGTISERRATVAVWSMPITESMKNSVLYEGQALYSDRDPDSFSNRSLLANALENAAKNDLERSKLAQYKQKIALIDSEEQKLHELKAQIKELSFKGRTASEEKKKKDLQFEAKQTENRINTYDRQLLSLEASKPIKDVLDREKKKAYKRAEQKGKEALAAHRAKDAETQRKLLEKVRETRKQGIESRKQTVMRHKIRDVVGELNQYLLRGTKERHVPIGLQKAVAEALDTVNMDTVGAEERIAKLKAELMKAKTPEKVQEISRKIDRVQQMGERMDERLTALKNAYAEIKKSDDPLIANSHDEVISSKIESVIQSVGDTPLRDMNLTQLEDVYDMYRMVLTTIRNANRSFRTKKKEAISLLGNKVMEQVEAVGGSKTHRIKMLDGMKQFAWNAMKPVYAMEAIGSETLSELYSNVRAGEDTWAVDVEEAKAFYKSQAEKHGYDAWDKKQQYQFTTKRGESFSLSVEQMMSLYAYSKRKQADLHLDLGGFVFDEAIEVVEKKHGLPIKYTVNTAKAHAISKETLADIISKLTDEQRAFVDEMQDYLSTTMGAKGNEVALEMYGIKLFKEKHYFPLKSAKQFIYEQNEVAGEVRIKNSGFSKETVARANNPVILSDFTSVWANHVNDMSMYHAFVLPLEDFNRVFNYKTPTNDNYNTESVKMYIQNAYGSQPIAYIRQLLTELNGGARVDATAGVMNKLIGKSKKASVLASASVVIQQPSALFRAMAYIDPKYFIGKPSLTKHKETWAEVKKYAPVAIIKEMGYFDTGMGQSTVEWIKGNKSIWEKGEDFLTKAPALADELTWCGIWKAVKREVSATTNLQEGSEEFMKAVGERFTDVVAKTQVYDSVLARSGMMRSKDTGMKMATAFMAEPTTTMNMIVDAIIKGKRGDKTFARKAIGAVSAATIVNAALVALVYAARDDDEDETYTEKYLESITAEILDGFNPLTYIPFVKDAWSIAQGFDVERSDMSLVSDLWQSVENLFGNASTYDKVSGVAGSLASLLGVPLKNIMRDAEGVLNFFQTITSGTPTTSAGIWSAIIESAKDSLPLVGRFSEKASNSDKLYEAIMSGDAAQIERIKGNFKDQSAIDTALRSGLRENDKRIHEAAQARVDGDIEEYKRIVREIVAEGNFSQDIVVGAVNAETNAIKRGESEQNQSDDTEGKDAVSIYKASDISAALESGNKDLAKEIIDDLVATKVANGMDEKTARSSLRSSMTSQWKPLYKQAYKDKDTDEMKRIRKILRDSGLYGGTNDIMDTVKNWLKDD